MAEPTPMDAAYEIAKLHAAVDASFDERLTWQWFRASWEICAEAAGFIYPARQVTEAVTPNRDGTVQLTGRPTSEVRLFSNGVLVAVLPPNAPELSGHRALRNPYAYNEDDMWWCSPALCCLNGCLQAQYSIGENVCGDMPARFLQAVNQVFAHIVENRGDTKLDDQILTRSGAKGFLAADLTYVA